MKTYLDAHVRCVSLMAPIVASVFLFATGLAAQQQVLDIGRDMYLGTAVHDSNLTVWPVYSSRPAKKIPGNFISLTEAQKRGKVEIREMGTSNSNQIAQQQSRRNSINETDSAVVNQLVIENKSKNPILVLAGTLLKGGKQDRQVGQDFIVPAHKTVPVGAFCVEHGRWTASRDGRATNGKFQAQETLATKPVRSSGQHENNQSQVWESVAKENAKAGKAPGSGTLMATVENADKNSTKRRKHFLKTVSTHFKALSTKKNRPVGIAYAVDGNIKEIRYFTHPRIFEKFTQTLISTIAMEADLAQSQAVNKGKPIYKKKADAKKIVDLIKEADKIKAQSTKTKAGNTNKTRKSANVYNADCFDENDLSVPLSGSVMSVE